MKQKIILSILVFIFILSTIPLHSGIFPFQVHRKVLDNGMKILVIPLPNPGLVAYYSVVRTGSRDEYEPGHSGFAHFFEHMMFRGTKRFPNELYQKILTEMGAASNGYTSLDLTVYHLIITKDDLEQLMDMESDRFRNLEYTEQDFKTESGAVYGEYLKNKTNPGFLLNETLMNTAFDVHTYKHTTMGFEADIKAMPTMYEYSKSFFKRYYRPENVVLVVCGDVVPDQVFKMAEKYYGPWEKGYVPPKIQEEPEQTAPRSGAVKFEGKTLPILAVGYKGLRYMPDSKEYVALSLLGDIMFGSTSDFYNNLVLEKQIAQFAFAGFSGDRDPSINTIMVMIKKKENIDLVKQTIADTIKKFQTDLMDAKKLDDLKNSNKYSFLMQLSSTGDVAGMLPSFIALTGDITAIDTYFETLGTITPEDIRQAAIKYLTDNRKTEILLEGE